ncbi:isopeptide-forming domain-containing fimbrial protein, partial [Enterococcus lactis]|uniref:isopeptide-forming domain-containing fimbrial protein n=1 Tax=Enterococcus lactis TaxID=357441 RepID=UPI0030D04ECD
MIPLGIEKVAVGENKVPESPLEIDSPTPPTKTEVIPSPGNLETTKKVFDISGNSLKDKEVRVGDKVEYRISVKNTGDKNSVINNVQVIDNLPTGLSYVKDSLQVTLDGTAKATTGTVENNNIVVPDIGSLKGGQEAIVSFQATITEEAKDEIINLAKVDYTTPPETPGDPDVPGTKEPEDPEKIKVPAKVTLEKEVSQEKAYVGNELTYTITTKNAEDAGIWKGFIKDDIPSNMVSYVPESTTVNGTSVKDTDVWKDGTSLSVSTTLKAGQVVKIVFKVKVLPEALNQTIKNIATGEDPEDPKNNIPATPEVPTEVIPNPESISKVISNKPSDTNKSPEIANKNSNIKSLPNTGEQT